MRCSLCHANIDLWDLTDWQGEPVHGWCGAAADRAWADALDHVAAEKRRARERRSAAA
mgnify:CR=1